MRKPHSMVDARTATIYELTGDYHSPLGALSCTHFGPDKYILGNEVNQLTAKWV